MSEASEVDANTIGTRSLISATNDALKKAAEIAALLLAGRIDFVIGVRQLDTALRASEQVHEPFARSIAGVASEIDDVIVGEGRTLWSSPYLKRVDGEVSDYASRVRDAVSDACRIVIARAGR